MLDGIRVLQTNSNAPAARVAWQYKNLWQVEHLFRAAKSLLRTRPAYHHSDAAIRGHVFCSFLASVLRKELYAPHGGRGDRIGTERHHPQPRLPYGNEDRDRREELRRAQRGQRSDRSHLAKPGEFTCLPSYGARTAGTLLRGRQPRTDRQSLIACRRKKRFVVPRRFFALVTSCNKTPFIFKLFKKSLICIIVVLYI